MDVCPTRKPLRPRSIPDLPGAIRQRSDLDVWQGFCPAHSADLCRKVREAGDTYDRLDSWKSNPDRWLQSSPPGVTSNFSAPPDVQQEIGRASCRERGDSCARGGARHEQT